MWLSAQEALTRLNVKAQTLYANVSRGRIAARPDPADPRRRLYNSDDVERLARKSAGRRPAVAVAAEAIRWGEPVLETTISTIVGGRLFYRGRDAGDLSETATFEATAQLLWQTDAVPEMSTDANAKPGLAASFAALAARAPADAPSYGRSAASLGGDAASVLATMAGSLAGGGQGHAHVRLAVRWSQPKAADPIRRALVLLADHELNASTFAARVAVSTGAALSSGALAGLATLTGPLHGSAAAAVFSLARRAAEIGPEAAIRERLAEGRPLPAFGHRLYPDGDVRAWALLAAFEPPPLYENLAKAAESLVGERPNVDFALAALAAAYHLPAEAPIELFALARSAGWLAHMLEQAQAGGLIRPRARYVGVKPAPTLAVT